MLPRCSPVRTGRRSHRRNVDYRRTEAKFDFSDAYYDAEVTMAVAKGSDIKTFDDLKGQKVAIKTGTNGGDYAKSVRINTASKL